VSAFVFVLVRLLGVLEKRHHNRDMLGLDFAGGADEQPKGEGIKLGSAEHLEKVYNVDDP